MNAWDSARDGKYEILEYVLKSDPSHANRKDDNDVTPLCYAVIGRKPASAKLLIRHGAKVNVPSKTSTPIIFAAMEGDIEMVELLLEAKAKVMHYNKHGLSPLHAAVTAECIPLIKRFVEYKPSTLNYSTPSVGTPLHLACAGSCVPAVQTLLELGADVSIPLSDSGRTAVHSAVESGNIAILKALLEGIRDQTEVLDIADSNGMTALNMASYCGYTEMVKELLDAGASIDKGTTDDNTTSLCLACQEGKLDTIKLLIERGANVNHKTDLGSTPLHSAAACIAPSRVEVLEYMLSKGALPDVQDTKGNTPSHFAAFRGNGDFIPILLEAGADAAVKNEEGKTATEEFEKVREQAAADRAQELEAMMQASSSNRPARVCSLESCANTESQSGTFKRCGRCKVKYYCSQRCQLQDWKLGHRGECKEAKSNTIA